MNEIQSAYRDKGVVIAGIAIQSGDSVQVSDEFVKPLTPEYPILLDNGKVLNGLVYSMYGVQKVPAIFFIDREGWIQVRYDAHLSKEQIEKELDSLL